MDDLIRILSEIRSNYNCFDENEEPYYRALSEAIQLASAQPDWMERNKERILQAGMEGREIEFRIGSRLFAIREEVFQEKMETAYQEGQKERNEPCTTNVIDPIDEVKRLADKIGIYQLYVIARDMRGESDTEIKLCEENDKLRIALEEAREAVNHNSKLVEKERLRNELYRKDGEVQGLKYAMRCLFVKEENR